MAESETVVAESETVTEQVADVLTNVVSDVLNDTFGKSNASTTSREVSNLDQGISYVFLLLMAVGPIYYGSWRSTKSSKEDQEIISKKDAMKFPFIASATLFGIFLFFKVLPQNYIDNFIALYFFVLGTLAMLQVGGSWISKLCPSFITNKCYKLSLNEKNESEENYKENMSMEFDNRLIFAGCICTLIALWYSISKHWIANNFIGLAFSINAIEILKLNSVVTGAILLGGLFLYDIFWVFGTNVMVTVAKNFNAPIKVVFPHAIMKTGLYATKETSMLGLGDIVIPGIFIALLLRFDLSLGKDRRTYFHTGFIAYICGLITTIAVMVVFKHAQPALLYLVPFCVGATFVVAIIKGELKQMLEFNEEEIAEETTTKNEAKIEGDLSSEYQNITKEDLEIVEDKKND